MGTEIKKVRGVKPYGSKKKVQAFPFITLEDVLAITGKDYFEGGRQDIKEFIESNIVDYANELRGVPNIDEPLDLLKKRRNEYFTMMNRIEKDNKYLEARGMPIPVEKTITFNKLQEVTQRYQDVINGLK